MPNNCQEDGVFYKADKQLNIWIKDSGKSIKIIQNQEDNIDKSIARISRRYQSHKNSMIFFKRKLTISMCFIESLAYISKRCTLV